MILSHRHRFIFLKPMKVAGTSLEIALSRHCGPDDILTPFGRADEAERQARGFAGARNHRTPLAEMRPRDWLKLALYRQRPRRFYAHDSAARVRALVPAAVWDGYLKISVVRNPYDTIVSRYFWEARLGPLPPFRDWLMANPELLLTNRRITHLDGVCVVDEMIRYEQFATDLTRLSQRLSLPSDLGQDMAGIATKTGQRPKDPANSAAALFADFPEGRALVALLCRDDIEAYGYALPPA